MFARPDRRPARARCTSAAFKHHVREASLPRITLHGLRHTYVTIALDAGADVLYVAELLGHGLPAMTQGIYQPVRAAVDSRARR